MTVCRTRPSTCRICGTKADNPFYTVREMMFGTRDAFDYFQCTICGCLQIEVIPADISRYYPPQYYSFTPKRRLLQHTVADRRLRWIKDHYTVFNTGLFGRFISRFMPNKKLAALSRLRLSKQARILDIGCGDGWCLYTLREIGFTNLLGIDPFLERDIEYDNGLQVLKRSAHDLSGEWDLIMYHHSFEHVPEPIHELQSVSRLLRPGGCCLLRIPTVSSFAWEHYRENWYQLDAPRHYHLYSVKSVNLLAENCGFLTSAVVYDSTKDQFLGSELYRKGIPLVSGNDVFSRGQKRKWKREAEQLNKERRGDQAAFYLIKR